MKITDGEKTVIIKMHVWNGQCYSEDWAKDFFEAGSLYYDEITDSYLVPNVDYSIYLAKDWESESNRNNVFVTRL